MRYRERLAAIVPHTVRSGVEVGVHRGKTSAVLLRYCPNLRLLLVDPWAEWDDGDIAKQEDRLREARLRTNKFGQRAVFMRMTSQEAAELICDGFLDFAFIDAEHDYDSVCTDLRLWYPKLKEGGMLICHDYGKAQFGVTPAVDQFAERHGMQLHVEAPSTSLAWMCKANRRR